MDYALESPQKRLWTERKKCWFPPCFFKSIFLKVEREGLFGVVSPLAHSATF